MQGQAPLLPRRCFARRVRVCEYARQSELPAQFRNTRLHDKTLQNDCRNIRGVIADPMDKSMDSTCANFHEADWPPGSNQTRRLARTRWPPFAADSGPARAVLRNSISTSPMDRPTDLFPSLARAR